MGSMITVRTNRPGWVGVFMRDPLLPVMGPRPEPQALASGGFGATACSIAWRMKR